ncbi:uncharacterized protein LOC135225184 isoform X2 [Macrobrachium nipponense]|uniref:uncharacterized protein LOC135225184 isoform X2 n=1 Tax=Macrobrachium nipponense TaxID=159736 RepID=UPI0030C82983
MWLMLVTMLPMASQFKDSKYGREDIYFGKFYKAATNTNRRLLKDVFMILFYRSRVLPLESWPNNVEEYCLSVLGWSKTKYRDSFNAEERKLLSIPLESLEGDTSLLNKMMLKLFVDANLPKPFFSALRELKNVRNRVCHDQLDFSAETLQANMDDLKNIFRKFLNEFGEAWDYDVSQYENNYCNELDEIMAAPITEEGLSYFEKMEEFREDLMGKFIIHGRIELLKFYAKLKVLNPFIWLKDEKFPELQVDKIFTPLHISDECRIIDIENLLVTEVFVEEDNEYICKGEIPSVVMLTGIAGCGKTSLCRYLLHDWRNKLDKVINMRSVDILILVEARNVVTSSLVSFLQQVLLKETCSHFEEKDIIPTLQKLNVLYLVDGVDEATDIGRKLLEEIFSVLSTSRLILTTRPEFTSSIAESIHSHHLSYIKLQIHGFADAGVAKFTSKIFHSLETDEKLRRHQEEECLKFLTTAGIHLGSHLKIPLTVALLIILWRDERSTVTNITSVTKLYLEIFKICSMKMLSRIRKSTSSTHLFLEDFVEKWLLELGQQAYDMIKEDEYIISDRRKNLLMSFCNKHNIDCIHALSSFLMCEVQESLFGPQYSFTFIHKSQMEYLAGRYFAHMLNVNFISYRNDDPEVIEKIKSLSPFLSQADVTFKGILEMRKMMNVYVFMIGHLCMNDHKTDNLISMVTENLLSIARMDQNYPAIWCLVRESERYPLVCKMVSDSISGKFVWMPEGEELCDPSDPIFQLLKYTEFVPKKISIRIINSTQGILVKGEKNTLVLRPYENLVPLLHCIGNKPTAEIILRADQHFYNWGDQEMTDHLLEALAPRGNLTTFMGHLGVPGAEFIKSFESLKVLYVRISSTEALHALSVSVNALSMKAGVEMNLRLDIPREAPPSSLPTFGSSFAFTISLFDITDGNASWAIEVISQLSKQYVGIELLSSKLSSNALKIFLRTLMAEKCKVKGTIFMPLSCKFSEKEIKKLKKCVNYKLDLW